MNRVQHSFYTIDVKIFIVRLITLTKLLSLRNFVKIL